MKELTRLVSSNSCRDIPTDKADQLWSRKELEGSDSDEYELDSASELDDILHDGAYEDNQCHWKFCASESTYDLTLVQMLETEETWNDMSCGRCTWVVFKLIFLVALNAALQLPVVFSVDTLVDLTSKGRLGMVFAPSGNCARDTSTEISSNPFLRSRMIGTAPQNWNCGPLQPFLMSNVSIVDTNYDGIWTQIADNNIATSARYAAEFGKGANLPMVFDAFMEEARKGNFVYQQVGKLSGSQSIAATANFTQIPMTWMKGEQSRITMCNNVDSALCGNLEVRGSLKINYPQITSTEKRILACRSHVHWCGEIFGELYKSYTEFAGATCKGVSPLWDADQGVILRRYDEADHYNVRVNNRAILSQTYLTFLLLILIIWWLIVLEEARQVLSWWIVIICIDGGSTKVMAETDDDGEKSIEIKSISLCSKILICIFINGPRTLIIILLAFIGTNFLVIADSFGDLILNSVALGFLIEVDDMLFAGVANEVDKERIKSLQDVKASTSCCASSGTHMVSRGTSLILVTFVLSMAAFQAGSSYLLPHGKVDLADAYQCICHAEGRDCIAAQILGGLFEVPTRYF